MNNEIWDENEEQNMNMEMNGQMNGDEIREDDSEMDENQKGGDESYDGNDLTDNQKLTLAERANEIYRQQLKYMQDHLSSLRNLIQDKEHIIENLMLRYDLGIIDSVKNKDKKKFNPENIQQSEELRKKAESLAQRTILENFELREMVNELREENFNLRNEIYELQDKINRQVLLINKLERVQTNNKKIEQFEENQQNEDIYDEIANNNNTNHTNANSISADDWLDNTSPKIGNDGSKMSKSEFHPSNTDEAKEKRLDRENKKHNRKESVKAPDMFNDSKSSEDEDEEGNSSNKNKKDHSRKESIATPDIFNSLQDESQEVVDKKQKRANHKKNDSIATPDIFNQNPEDADYDTDQSNPNKKGHKRRESKNLDKELNGDSNNDNNSHTRNGTLGPKPLFASSFDDSKESKKDLAPSKSKHQKKSSKMALLFDGTIEIETEQQKKHERKKSKQIVSSQLKDGKKHFSDPEEFDEDAKPKKKKKFLSKAKKIASHSKKTSMTQEQFISKFNPDSDIAENGGDKKRRRSSIPIPKLFEQDEDDPDAKLNEIAFETLKKHLDQKTAENQKLNVNLKKLENDIIKNDQKHQLNLVEIKKEIQDNYTAQITFNENKIDTLNREIGDLKIQLHNSVQTKHELVKKCSTEILRLSAIVNTMLQFPGFNKTVQMLISDSKSTSN